VAIAFGRRGIQAIHGLSGLLVGTMVEIWQKKKNSSPKLKKPFAGPFYFCNFAKFCHRKKNAGDTHENANFKSCKCMPSLADQEVIKWEVTEG